MPDFTPQDPSGRPAPPPLPPEVAAQMGMPPEQVMASRIVPKPNQNPMAGPQGATLKQATAIESVLKDMSRMNPKFAPFADRMVNILKQGMVELTGGATPDNGTPSPMAVPGQSSLRPPTASGGSEFIG